VRCEPLAVWTESLGGVHEDGDMVWLGLGYTFAFSQRRFSWFLGFWVLELGIENEIQEDDEEMMMAQRYSSRYIYTIEHITFITLFPLIISFSFSFMCHFWLI
jgi:hypothetical protein